LVQPAAVAAWRWQSLAPGTQQDCHHAVETGSDQRQLVMPDQDDVSSHQCFEEHSHILTDQVHFACNQILTCLGKCNKKNKHCITEMQLNLQVEN